jgi:hypothetical protein
MVVTHRYSRGAALHQRLRGCASFDREHPGFEIRRTLSVTDRRAREGYRARKTHQRELAVSTWEPNLLLLQIIEAVKKELAVALDILPRWQDLASDCPNPMLVEHVRKIAGLRASMAALEGALTHPDSGIIH